MLALSRMTVYRMVQDGTLPSIRTGTTGHTYRIPRREFAAYLREAGTPRPAHVPGQMEIPA